MQRHPRHHPEARKCPDCGSVRLKEDRAHGDVVCTGCGLVVEGCIIDDRAEWRTFSDKDGGGGGGDPSRVGAPTTTSTNDPFAAMLQDLHLPMGASHFVFGGGSNSQKKRLQRAQDHDDKSKKAKGLANGLDQLKRLAERLDIVSVATIQTACQLFKHGIESGLLKGRQTMAIIASCVFMACKHHAVPRTFKEIAGLLADETSKKEIGACFKILNDKILRAAAGAKAKMTTPSATKTTEQQDEDTIAPPAVHAPNHPATYMQRFCNILRLPIQVRKAMEEMAYNTTPGEGSPLPMTLVLRTGEGEEGVGPSHSSHLPVTVAATIVYIVTRIRDDTKPVELPIIRVVTDVAESTVQAVLREWTPRMKDLLPKGTNSDAHVQRIFSPTPKGGSGGAKAKEAKASLNKKHNNKATRKA